MKILFVLTSHDRLGDTEKKTGFWIEEFATPYYYLIDKGVDITLASPKGGRPPIDPSSDEPQNQTDSTKRFHKDEALKDKLSKTIKLSEIDEKNYDAVFYPGGHGPLWDLSKDIDSIRLIQSFYENQKPTGLVCHAPAALKNVKTSNGDYLVKGKKVTGFTNSEEAAVELTEVVPFLVENMLKENGGTYSKANDWEPYAVQDNNLITGQNPASSEKVVEKLFNLLKN
ncbi:type 1 glutamine amidotransferase domain-containing protein [Aquimarina sp. AD1]|uniref:type 1 glutamine amidotransferase domain-containing protein n=1 Tax=Aquimarina sp. (strain AD1) TaxID=1714848 RepID=UPI000E4C4A10|nr:type 1 glutamine amidotransferase domain-containing protein [Aquimarina sp. AD1]AXT57154.1 type 1 glutamine amidotransferase domain-containing protein [Aquimarina sp. AD1]RKN37161.1 type 1 glutamine amidotransferase domain-containing protein [Aquimarina sp. AD1]